MEVKFKSIIEYLDKLKLHHIIIEENILKKFSTSATKNIYTQRFTIRINDQLEWEAGSVALGNQRAYITVSKARLKELGIELGDTVDVCLKENLNELGFEIPIEFEEVLKQDCEAKRRFEQLKPGFKRHLVYLIKNFKTSQSRVDKSISYLENLKKSPEGNTTMRNIYGKDLP